MHRLIILTGASGSGKTTIAREITRRPTSEFKVLHFDDIGIPSVSEMIKEFGSPEEWQRHHTKSWLSKICKDFLPNSPVLFEGQMRIAFLKEAMESLNIQDQVKICLVDCGDEERFRRLRGERGQDNLCTPDMLSWADYLRKEANTAGIKILDTTSKSIHSCLQEIFPISAAETEIAVFQVSDVSKLNSVVPLFDQYRQFYGQKSDFANSILLFLRYR